MFKIYKRRAKFFKATRICRLPYMPHILNIEPGNVCNLKCPLCPTGSGDKSMKKGFMGLAAFKKILDELAPHLEVLNFYSWGEPLLNKDFVKMVEYARLRNKRMRIITSTNLNINDDRLLADLVRSGIDEVIISCDGATPQAYGKYRVDGDFDLVMRNMKFIADENRKSGGRVDLVWNFIVFKHNEHEVQKARKMAEEIGVNFRVGKMRVTMKDEILRPKDEAIRKDLAWIPDNPQYSAYNKDTCTTKKVITACRKPWQEISINWNGDVFPCCAVYGDQYNIGNINNAGIRQVWNNTGYIRARKEIIGKSGEITTVCGICRKNGFMHM
ncbi:MAG: radical SAM protein [Candidatus Omnitrophica bacterium]|nr:radical SAM protein [Candidatus Omnitrophota bacterium]